MHYPRAGVGCIMMDHKRNASSWKGTGSNVYQYNNNRSNIKCYNI